MPLFWRLDLDVRAASVANDRHYDAENPAARAGDGEWSRPASALANAIGAVKAVARSQDATARGLLDRGFARIDEPDRATGAWGGDVARLARAAIPPWWTWPLRSPRSPTSTSATAPRDPGSRVRVRALPTLLLVNSPVASSA
jgi:hypothetical protein